MLVALHPAGRLDCREHTGHINTALWQHFRPTGIHRHPKLALLFADSTKSKKFGLIFGIRLKSNFNLL